MVTSRDISPAEFRVRRLLANHKQVSLAHALGCTPKTIRNFEKGKTRRIYCAQMDDVRRELRLNQAA